MSETQTQERSAVATTAVIGGNVPSTPQEVRLQILEKIASGEPTEVTLSSLCQIVETVVPTVRVVVHRVSGTSVSQVGAGTLDSSVQELQRKLEIDPRELSTGACAVKKEAVMITDILINPLTTKIRAQAESAGLKSAFSIPIIEGSHIAGVATFYSLNSIASHVHLEPVIDLVRSLSRIAFITEGRLAKVTELEVKNKDLQCEIDGLHMELDAGKSTLMHDIRAPIKVLNNQITQMMEKSLMINDHGTHEGLEKMRITALRVEHLILDMLKIANLTRSDLTPVDIDFTKTAEKIVKDVVDKLHRPDAKISIQPGIQIHADAQFLEMILENLIANALRFTSKNPVSIIDIGMSTTNGKQSFFVKDNSPGFHPHHISRVFEPSERLHMERDFPGAGLALATVKRLVERHGGKTWAISGIGKGCTFAFTIGEVTEKK